MTSRKATIIPGSTQGFTLVELMVTVSIFIFMTVLLVSRYGSFDNTTILTNTAYDIGLTIRTAQSYGLNVQGISTTTGQQAFIYPYGVHFETGANKAQMVLFVDANRSGAYEGAAADVAVTTYTLQRGAYVSSLCAGSASSPCAVRPAKLDVTFKRPDPSAILEADGSATCGPAACTYAQITVSNIAGDATRVVTVQQTGQIAVGTQ